MKKADMLEEIKSELSLINRETIEKKQLYRAFINLLSTKMPHYKSIYLYITSDLAFHYAYHEGIQLEYDKIIPFGDEFLSITAARGEISCEFNPTGQHIFIPFYEGHHLIGEMIISTSQFIDGDELNFIQFIQLLLNENGNFSHQ